MVETGLTKAVLAWLWVDEGSNELFKISVFFDELVLFSFFLYS